MHITIAALTLSVLTWGCGDDGRPLDSGSDANPDSSGDTGLGDTGLDDTGLDVGPIDGAPDAGPPTVTVVIAANGDVFPHADGLGGQTARATVAGVRSFALYRTMDDPDPLVLFTAAGADVAVGYVPGDATTLTTIDASALVPGTYTFGRLVQTYGRYEVDARLHRLDGTHDGVVQAFQVIGDNTEVGGSVYDSGHYELTFTAPGVTEEWSGEDGPFPTYSTTAGAVGIVEGGEWAIYFPIDFEITAPPIADTTLTLDVNMYEGFRWTDLLVLGFEVDVFDATDISFEPVIRFGGNAFELTMP